MICDCPCDCPCIQDANYEDRVCADCFNHDHAADVSWTGASRIAALVFRQSIGAVLLSPNCARLPAAGQAGGV